MSFICRNCRKAVPEDCLSCPQCGTEIDPFGTISAPVLRPGGSPARTGNPATAPALSAPLRDAGLSPIDEDKEDEPRRTKATRTPSPRPATAKVKPRPKAPPAPPAAPPPTPQLAPAVEWQAYPPQVPTQAPLASAPGKAARPWLGRLKEAIGLAPGQPGQAEPTPDTARSMPPQAPAVGMVVPQYPPPNGWANGQPAPTHPQAGGPAASWPQYGQGGWGAPAGAWQPASAPQGSPAGSWPQAAPGGWGPVGSPYGPAAPPPPASTPAGALGQDDDQLLTVGAEGVDVSRLKIHKHQYVLQLFDRHGRWVEWQRIGQNGLKVGRVKDSRQHPALSTMASRHLRLGYEDGTLIAEDLGSLNGVYRLVTRPVALADGQRFRVGRYVLEFHEGRGKETVPLVGEDGEEFCGADLPVLGHIDFIGRDGRPGPRHMLTKGREPTVVGRGGRPGRPVDVALPDDDRISGLHAQLRPEGEQFLLEDLGSRNGTFVQLLRPTPVEHNDVLLIGQLLLRVAAVG